MLLRLPFLIFIGAVVSDKVRYDDYALYKLHPKSEEDVQFLKHLHDNSDGLDFWMPPSKAGQFVSVVSPLEKRKEFEHALSKRSIFSEVMLENIQDAFDAQTLMRKKRDTSRHFYWTSYQSYDDIVEWFEYLAETHSDVVSLISAGTSHEGRNLTGIKISRGNSGRVFLLEAGQVAADWLSPTVVTYIVDQLVKGEDPEAYQATEEFEWHIFPIVNPDGHEFSDNSVRLWVKNRRPITSTAIGVDLTKNWNSQWGVSGGSFVASDNNYIGIGPFTEPETRSLSRYIETVGGRLTGFLSFRSFGQRLVIPFAHTTEHMYNYNEMVTIGRRAMGSLSVKYNTQYLVGTSKDVLDGATGSITDWVKYRFNPPIAATYYLRDQGAWGYTLPVNQVLPSCEETYDSVMAILREARFVDAI